MILKKPGEIGEGLGIWCFSDFLLIYVLRLEPLLYYIQVFIHVQFLLALFEIGMKTRYRDSTRSQIFQIFQLPWFAVYKGKENFDFLEISKKLWIFQQKS